MQDPASILRPPCAVSSASQHITAIIRRPPLPLPFPLHGLTELTEAVQCETPNSPSHLAALSIHQPNVLRMNLDLLRGTSFRPSRSKRTSVPSAMYVMSMDIRVYLNNLIPGVPHMETPASTIKAKSCWNNGHNRCAVSQFRSFGSRARQTQFTFHRSCGTIFHGPIITRHGIAM